MLLRDLDRVLRLFQIRPGHHHLLAPGGLRALDHPFEVIFVRLLAMVHAAEDGIAQVDTDLGKRTRKSAISRADVRTFQQPGNESPVASHVRERTSMYLSLFDCSREPFCASGAAAASLLRAVVDICASGLRARPGVNFLKRRSRTCLGVQARCIGDVCVSCIKRVNARRGSIGKQSVF